MRAIMVTGALGNVGHYVAQNLIKNGENVVLADIDIDKLKKMYGTRTKCIYFDYTNISTFNAVIKYIDRVFIMRPPHLGKPDDLKPFIQSLKDKGGISLVCFLSLIGVENNPMPPHHKIEKYIEQAGLPYCHIRPSFFMQNISGIHAFEIQHFNRIVVPASKSLTSFIDAKDIGELTAKVLCNPQSHTNKAYSITGPEAIDYYTVAKILSDELGRHIIYANPRSRQAKQYWVGIRGLDKDYSLVMSMLYMMTRLGTAKRVTTTYEEIVGKSPQTFRQFVRKNLSSWG